jgi:hypothetical protein
MTARHCPKRYSGSHYAARRLILGCQNCAKDADIPFTWVLDRVMAFSGADTDYVLTEVVNCPWRGYQ